ncbi:MAG: hypothetical protein HY598_05380 [Candidatus Omnitrophica bacterium]|nr:hypothetical protein [Candidatus Omnitrophota bacterium]
MLEARNSIPIQPPASSLQLRSVAFTLIELAFVTAILVILLAVSAPKFQQVAERLRTEQSIVHFAQTLRAARERAIAEARPVAWVWDEQARRTHLEAVGADRRLERLEDRMVSVALPSSVVVQISRQDQPVECRCIYFLPDGSSDPTTTLAVKSPTAVYTVTVHEATGWACLAAGTAAC